MHEDRGSTKAARTQRDRCPRDGARARFVTREPLGARIAREHPDRFRRLPGGARRRAIEMVETLLANPSTPWSEAAELALARAEMWTRRVQEHPYEDFPEDAAA